MLAPTDETDSVPPPLTLVEARALVAASFGGRVYRVRGRCAVEVPVVDMTGAPIVATAATWEDAIHAALTAVGR